MAAMKVPAPIALRLIAGGGWVGGRLLTAHRLGAGRHRAAALHANCVPRRAAGSACPHMLDACLGLQDPDQLIWGLERELTEGNQRHLLMAQTLRLPCRGMPGQGSLTVALQAAGRLSAANERGKEACELCSLGQREAVRGPCAEAHQQSPPDRRRAQRSNRTGRSTTLALPLKSCACQQTGTSSQLSV